MIKKFFVVFADSGDAYKNQALEAALTGLACDTDAFILYLWSNDNAVFIGKNQNAYLECDINRLSECGGSLLRRLSGGGAVYHDKGNLNYSYIAPKSDYSQKNQFGITLSALKSLGINASLSGRNDILVGGKKFSGNAFYHTDKFGLHHGTILIRSDYEKIGRYLTASKLKLSSKNVGSVLSRVVNLSEIKKDITKEEMSFSLIKAAENYLGNKAEYLNFDSVDKNIYHKWLDLFTDKAYILGDNIYYNARIQRRFDWGIADIRLKIDKNIIQEAKIYSDCLDTSIIEKKEAALRGQDIYSLSSSEAAEIIDAYRESI